MRNDDSRNNGKNKISRKAKFMAVFSCALMVTICLSAFVPDSDAASSYSEPGVENRIVVDGFRYDIITDTTNLIFRGYDEKPTGEVDLVIKYEVEFEGTTYHVKTIGDNVLKSSGNVDVRSVYMEDGIERISPEAFEGIAFPFVSVRFSETLKSIGNEAFNGCVSLKSIVIPDSVETIGKNAFSGCSDVERLVIGNGVITIGEGAFSCLESITEVAIGNNVKTIDASAFIQCTFLEKLIIPDSVEEIGFGAFAACSSIKTLIIGKNVKYIGEQAFNSLGKLESLIIPESVEEICAYAFADMLNLKHIEIRTKSCEIDSNAFGDTIKFYGSDGKQITDMNELCGKTFNMLGGQMVASPPSFSDGWGITAFVAIIVLLSSMVAIIYRIK